MQLFKNPRIAVATAATSAALVGAGAVAAVSVALDDDPVAAPQVTVTDATPTANSDSTTVGEIYKRQLGVGRRDHGRLGRRGEPVRRRTAARSRPRAPASSTTPRAT